MLPTLTRQGQQFTGARRTSTLLTDDDGMVPEEDPSISVKFKFVLRSNPLQELLI